MKRVAYKSLSVGAGYKLDIENTPGINVYTKGEDTDFDHCGNMINAERDDAFVFVGEEEPESIDFRRHAVFKLVGDELDAARQNHPPMNSHHEAYGVILEEVDEYWAEVKKKAKDRRPSEVRAELVQIAAMACRAIIDLDLL